MTLASAARRFFAGTDPHPPRWAEHGRMFDAAVMLVRVFYVITAFKLYERLRSLMHFGGDVEDMLLLWPVRWLEWTGAPLGAQIILHLCIVAAFLCFFAWRFLLVRVIVSLALLQVMAIFSSFGHVGHGNHEWFWVSVCFWFLPTGKTENLRQSRAGRMSFLLGFSTAPALILLFYTLSGGYKIWHATTSLVAGEFGGFHPYAMASTLAWRSLQTNFTTPWAEILIGAPILGWPLYLGLYFIELMAFVVFFRPVLHRLWGILLIAFHFGTMMFMDIPFPDHVLVNGLLFVLSPFVPVGTTWRDVALAVPVFAPLFRLWLGAPERRAVSPRSEAAQAA